MNRDKYLASAFDKFNKGEISAEAYDAILMNLDEFVDVPKVFSPQEDSLYQHFVEKTYGRYKWDWCQQRGVKPEDIDDEVGINGECYASFEEFLDNEYQDREYMEHLLSADEFEWWEVYSQKESIGVIEVPQPFKNYRVVLTCFDHGEEPYGDCHEELFFSQNAAYEKAKSMATEECADLNGEDSGIGPDVGCFEVDDCANNDFEVRWYEKKSEERDEGSCDIEYVTTYNVYPVEFIGPNNACKYRGFDINKEGALYNVSKDGTVFGGGESLLEALSVADDMCLMCSKDKTCALEAVHKVPLDVIVKFASKEQERVLELYGNRDLSCDVGER